MHEESVIPCHLKPAFGAMRLDELTPTKCKDFRKAMQDKELSGNTAGNNPRPADGLGSVAAWKQLLLLPRVISGRRRSVTDQAK